MNNQELLDLVKKLKSLGQTNDQIKMELTASGRNVNDIEQTLVQSDSNNPETLVESNKHTSIWAKIRKRLLPIILFIILALIITITITGVPTFYKYKIVFDNIGARDRDVYLGEKNVINFYQIIPIEKNMKADKESEPITFTLVKPDGSKIKEITTINQEAPIVCGIPSEQFPNGECFDGRQTGGGVNFSDVVNDQLGKYKITSSNIRIKSFSFNVVEPKYESFIIKEIPGYITRKIEPLNNGKMVHGIYDGMGSASKLINHVSVAYKRSNCVDNAASFTTINGQKLMLNDNLEQQNYFDEANPLNYSDNFNQSNYLWKSGEYCIYIKINKPASTKENPYKNVDMINSFVEQYLNKYPSSL